MAELPAMKVNRFLLKSTLFQRGEKQFSQSFPGIPFSQENVAFCFAYIFYRQSMLLCRKCWLCHKYWTILPFTNRFIVELCSKRTGFVWHLQINSEKWESKWAPKSHYSIALKQATDKISYLTCQTAIDR